MVCPETRTDLLDDAEAGSDFVRQLDLRNEIVGWQARKRNSCNRQPRTLYTRARVYRSGQLVARGSAVSDPSAGCAHRQRPPQVTRWPLCRVIPAAP